MLDSFSLGSRLGVFLIAAALLFAAHRVHSSRGKFSHITMPAGVVLAFIAGAAFLVSIVGDWMADFAATASAVAVAGLIVVFAIILVDWLMDGRPDRPAFIAALLLPAFMAFGFGNIGAVTGQVGEGVGQVGNQITEQVGE